MAPGSNREHGPKREGMNECWRCRVEHLQLSSGLLNPELPEAFPEASHFLLGDGGTIGH